MPPVWRLPGEDGDSGFETGIVGIKVFLLWLLILLRLRAAGFDGNTFLSCERSSL